MLSSRAAQVSYHPGCTCGRVHLTKVLKEASELSGEVGEGGEDMSFFLTSFSSSDILKGRVPSSSGPHCVILSTPLSHFLREFADFRDIKYHLEGQLIGLHLQL